MNRISEPPKLQYAVLLFVTILPIMLSRPTSFLIEGMGRNSVWYLFPILALVLAGASISLQISKRCGDTSLMTACGKVAFNWLTPVSYFLHAILYFGIAVLTIALSGSFTSQVLQYGDLRSALILETLIATGAALFPVETMIRFAQFLAIFAVPAIVALTFTMLMNAQWSWLLPIFNTAEMTHPLSASGAVLCIFSPLAALAQANRARITVTVRSLGACMTAAALFLSYLTAMSITTFGVHSAKRMEYLFFYAQSAVHIENFLLERIVFLSSLLLVFFKVVGNGFMMRSAAFCLVRVTGLKLGIAPILLTGGIAGAVLWTINMPVFFHYIPIWIGYYGFFLTIVFPVLIYIILLARGKQT